MTAKTSDGSFEQSVDIFTIPKRFSALIQTDKPIYKPGDKVRYRVLLIDSEMKPHIVETFRVEVVDALDTVVIEHIAEEGLEKGVISNYFDIAEEPLMGEWKLKAFISDGKTDEEDVVEYKFEVKEYVLPRFEVIVDTKHDVTQNEGVIRVTVYGNYTFGEFVKGKATITAKLYDSKFPDTVQHTVSKTVDVEFKKLVEFNMRNELNIVNEIRPYLVKFEVEFEEGLTGQKMKKNAEVRIFKTGEFFLELKPEEKRFKPGFTYKVKAIVRTFDGSLATDRFNSVNLKVNYFYKPPLCSINDASFLKNYEYNEAKMLKSGVTEFILAVSENTTAMAITATFNDVKTTLNVSRHESKVREYLVIKSLTTR